MSEANPFFDMHEHGFVRVATATPCSRPADVAYNTAGVLAEAHKAHNAHVDLVVFPELTLSSYAIDDLLLQHALIERVEQALAEVVAASADLHPVLIVGAPLRRADKLYNCAVVIAHGQILGVVPKSFLPNYREFYEKRHFAHGRGCTDLWIGVAGEEVPFGTDLVFAAAAFFAATHLQPLQFPALLLFGVILGFMAWRSGRIGPAIWAHVGFNVVAAAGLLFQFGPT